MTLLLKPSGTPSITDIRPLDPKKLEPFQRDAAPPPLLATSGHKPRKSLTSEAPLSPQQPQPPQQSQQQQHTDKPQDKEKEKTTTKEEKDKEKAHEKHEKQPERQEKHQPQLSLPPKLGVVVASPTRNVPTGTPRTQSTPPANSSQTLQNGHYVCWNNQPTTKTKAKQRFHSRQNND